MRKIAIVDDQVEICEILERTFRKSDYNVTYFTQGEVAINWISENNPDVVLLDIQMPDMDGIEVLDKIKAFNEKTKVIVMTAYPETDKIYSILDKGLCDFIAKPFKLNDIKNLVNRVLRDEKSFKNNSDNIEIVGRSEKMVKILKGALKISNSDASVLITGESGTGKEKMVDFIHNNSIRKYNELVKINCAAIPDHLLESELFGYEKGAFTGALLSKKGKVEEADGGTLFLDEVCEMNEKLQTKLLRILEYKTFERLGSNKTISSDFRLICATNKEILKEVKIGNFREDLYYRISTFKIPLPPLRERREDIELLAYKFLDMLGKDYLTSVKGISKDVLDVFKNYNWPGNVRELRNVMELALSVCVTDEITLSDLPYYLIDIAKEKKSLRNDETLSLEEIEEKHILKVLTETEGNKKLASKILGVSEKTLYNKINKYNIQM